MGFVAVVHPDPHGHGRTCNKLDSGGARKFGVGSVCYRIKNRPVGMTGERKCFTVLSLTTEFI